MSRTLLSLQLNAFELFNIPSEFEEAPSITIIDAEEFYQLYIINKASNNIGHLKKIRKLAGVYERVKEIIKVLGITGRVRKSTKNGKTYVILYNYIKKYRPKNLTRFLEDNVDNFFKKIPLNKAGVLKSISKNAKWAVAFNLVKVPIEIAVSILNDEEYNYKKELSSVGFDLSQDVVAIALAAGLTTMLVSATAPVWVSLVIGIAVSEALKLTMEKLEVKKNLLNAIDSNYESPKIFIPDQPEVKVNTKSLYIR